MIGVMICFDSTNTDVDIVLTLFPLSFRLSIIELTSMGQIGEIIKVLLYDFVNMMQHYDVMVLY